MGGGQHVRRRVAVELGERGVVLADAKPERPGGEGPHGAYELELLAQRRVEVGTGEQLGDGTAAEQDPGLGPAGADDVPRPPPAARREKDERREGEPARHGCAAARATGGAVAPYCRR